MQIRTEGPSREDNMQGLSESKLSVVSEKAHVSGPNFMDLMKSIQIRSQKVLEEGQKVSEAPAEKLEAPEKTKEPELFSETEEEDVEEISSEEETEDSKTIKLSEKKQISLEENLEEEVSESDLEEETNFDSPFITQMSAFLASLESKKEKETSSIHAEEPVLVKKSIKQNKEEIQESSSKEEVSSTSKPVKEEEKRNIKEIRKSAEKESLDEGLKSLEEVRKLSKPANEEKAQTALKEVSKENFIPESENWKITREKKQESLSQIAKGQTAKISAAEDSASKGDHSGKGSQNQEFSQRQGNETTLTLLKAGMGVQNGSTEISGNSSTRNTKSNSSAVMDRSAMKENFQRLVQTAKLNIVENGRSEATLRLNPRELGRVSLRISVEDDRVQGKILVESEQVRRLFMGDLEQLRKDFREQGLHLESLVIDMEDSFQSAWGDSGANGDRDSENIGVETSSLNSSSDIQVSELDSIEISEFADKNMERRLNILV